MSTQTATLKLLLLGENRSSRAFNEAASSADKMSRKLGNAGSTMTRRLTLPAVAAGVAAVKMASDYNASMQKINGLVGISQSQVDDWSGQILELGKTLPQAPKDLADAMFFITSAGLRGSTALDALEQSARASAAGLGDTTSVADAVTSAMNAYGSETLSATQATDILTAAVKNGKLEASALAPVIGQVIPIASEMGVSFDQVSAAIAAMSTTGADAAQATTQVSAILTGMLKPSVAGADALEKVGLSYAGLRKEIATKGLLPTLFHVKDAFKGNQEELTKVIPNVRALRGFLSLTGKKAEDTAAIFEDLANATGSTDAAFDSASKTADFKFKTALSSLQGSAIELGNELLPVVVDVLDKLTVGFEKFGEAPKPVKMTALALGGLLIVMGPVLTMTSRLITAWTLASAGVTKFGDATKAAKLRMGGAVAGIALLAHGATKAETTMGKLELAAGGAMSGAALGSFAGAPGIAVGAAIGGLAGLTYGLLKSTKKAGEEAKLHGIPSWREYGQTLDDVTLATTKATREMVYQRLESSGLLQATRQLGMSDRDAMLAMTGNTRARTLLAQKLSSTRVLTAAQEEALRKETGAIGQSRLAQLKKNIALAENAEELRKAKAKLREFMKEPASKRVRIDGVETAKQKLVGLRSLLYDVLNPPQGDPRVVVPGATIWGSMGGTSFTQKPKAPHSAVGATNFAGGLSWVGERGAELVEFPAGTRIHTAAESARMASAGGVGGDLGTITVVVQSESGEVIERKLARVKRTRGGTRLAFEAAS